MMGKFQRDVLEKIRDVNGIHGLDLAKAMGRHTAQVYLALKKLEGRGQISSTWKQNDEMGAPRRVYKITPEGRKALEG